MKADDIGQAVAWTGCAACLIPVVLLFVVLKLAAILERVALRHPLLMWLVPIAMWRRAERIERETDAYCAGHNCPQDNSAYHQLPPGQAKTPPNRT